MKPGMPDIPDLGEMANDVHGIPVMANVAPAAVVSKQPVHRAINLNKKDKLPKPEKRKIKPATLHNSLKHQYDRKQAGNLYSEDLSSKIGDAVDNSDGLQNKLQGVGDMNPAQRAQVGGLIGAHLGNKISGAHGSLIGAAIGSAATRSLGLAQSGEKALGLKQDQVMQVLKTVKLVSDSMQIHFPDKSIFDLSDIVSETLSNTSPNIAGKKARGVLELDSTNPFTSRAQIVAKPLAYYVVGALLKQTDFKDSSVLKITDNTATMFVNAFENGAKDIAAVYDRAKYACKKIGATESQMKQFFYNQRSSFSEQDAKDILQGTSILFGK